MKPDKKLVSECCGVSVTERNNEGTFCSECYAECDEITQAEWDEQNIEILSTQEELS